jgi:phage gpG-like protein
MGGLIGVNATSVREFGQTTLEFGTQRPWAWIHQDGGRRIPQRMMVGATDEAIDEVLDVIADAAVRMMFT